MRYEVRKDVDASGNETGQWAIWDNVENRAFARFKTEVEASKIVNSYYAAQLAAENAGA